MRALTLTLLALAAVALSGCVWAGAGLRGSGMNATEKMMWSTYPLVTRKGMGTGFLIARGGSRPPALITSVHVLDTVGHGPFVVAARVPDADGGAHVALIHFQPQRGAGRFYVRHPRYDIAAFALKLPEDVASVVSAVTFLDEKSVATPPGAYQTGAEVSFLGYPDVMPGTAGAFPLLRSGRVASYPVGTAGEKGLFVVDADVYPGDSGAPVFAAARGGRAALAGMIVRRAGADRRAFSHLAIAVEVSAISETLGLLAARENAAAASRDGGGQDRPSVAPAARSGGAGRR